MAIRKQMSEVTGSPLSVRETEIADLLCLGISSREIGERLFIAECTVKMHLTGLYRKLGVTTRSQCIVKLLDTRRNEISKVGLI